MKRWLLPGLLMLLIAETADGQFYANQYRPSGQNWQVLTTPHFRILFPEGQQELAGRTAYTLEEAYPGLQEKMGGSLRRFPVILNTESDRSNGFVSPFNFRTEVVTTPIRSKTLHPAGGDWLGQVLTHELVHALHFSTEGGGISSIAGLFSKDLQRSIHAAAPLGLLEGIAVYHETHDSPYGAGRGNYAWFTGRYEAVMISQASWSAGQHIQPPAVTRPPDRHYLGSYHFTDWILQKYGEESFREAIRLHHRWPIFGFGFALRRVTGEWPSTLFRHYRQESNLNIDSTPSRPEVPETISSLIDRPGVVVRRPVWIDNETILFHGSFYDSPTGFYLYKLNSEQLSLLLEEQVSEDYLYEFDAGNNQLTYAAYTVDARFDRNERLDLFRLDTDNGRRGRLTRNLRLFSPSGGEPLYAIQTDGQNNRLVTISLETNRALPVEGKPEYLHLAEISIHPADSQIIAIIARYRNRSALWIARTEGPGITLPDEPDISFENGSLFDLFWHPNEKRLLFSSDRDGSFNLYEYDVEQSRLYQLTNSPVNQFEPSWSPDGQRIAYLFHRDNRSLPAVLNLSATEPASIRLPEQYHQSFNTENPSEAGLNRDTGGDWPVTTWRTGLSWLAPRTITPYFEKDGSGFYRTGLGLQSTDLLGRHSYHSRIYQMDRHAWFDIHYRYSGFYPGFGGFFYQRPATRVWSGVEPIETIVRQRGGSAYLPFHYRIRQDTRLSELRIRPEAGFRQSVDLRTDRIPGLNHYEEDLFFTRFTASAAIRIRRYLQQVQPGAGWTFGAFTEIPVTNRIRTDAEHLLSGSRRSTLSATLHGYLTNPIDPDATLRLGSGVISRSPGSTLDSSHFHSPFYAYRPFPSDRDLRRVSFRYTKPLLHPDDGGFLIPVYLESVYLVLFGESTTPLERPLMSRTHTVSGGGIRARLRLSNLTIGLGFGIAYDFLYRDWTFSAGEF